MMASKEKKKRLSILLGLAISFSSLTAFAQQPSAADKEKARELMAQGRSERDSNNLAVALQRFQAADAIMHVPTTGYEVAHTQQMLGHLLEAQETVAAIAKLPVSPTDPPPFNEARAKAEALGKELATQIPSLKVNIVVSDPSAGVTPSLTIDDKPTPIQTTPYRLNPGPHVIVARGGGAEARESVALVASEVKDVELRLNVVAKREEPPVVKSDSKIPLISWVGFGVGAAGLVVGSVTGVMVFSREGDLADQCENKKCAPRFRDDVDSANTLATISTVGFIVAGVGAAVGVIGILTRPKVVVESKSTSAIRFTPTGVAGTF